MPSWNRAIQPRSKTFQKHDTAFTVCHSTRLVLLRMWDFACRLNSFGLSPGRCTFFQVYHVLYTACMANVKHLTALFLTINFILALFRRSSVSYDLKLPCQMIVPSELSISAFLPELSFISLTCFSV